MKLLFSEARPDYEHYVFPYAVWAFPEPGETPADFFRAGFLPSSRQLDRFYLCRQVRVDLARFRASSENRRILRRGAAFEATLVPRDQFDYTPERRRFYQAYATAKFGPGVMTAERLDSLFAAPIVTHLLLFTNRQTGAEVGTATLYVEEDRLAYYYYAFYDLAYFARNLGMFMMTMAVQRFAQRGCAWLHLGTCYARNALYKTQFAGAEFFNGTGWSSNLDELKFLLDRDARTHPREHLLECEEYRARFCPAPLTGLAAASAFRVPPDSTVPRAGVL